MSDTVFNQDLPRSLLIDSQVTYTPLTFSHYLRQTEHVKNEPMLWNCDGEHAWTLGGPITKQWLSQMPEGWQRDDGPVVVDTRVHMLMPGWMPCIPGWHHDDVIRDTPNGQPNYFSPTRSEHLMTLLNSDVSATEFAVGSAQFVIPADDQIMYQVWHPEVDALLLKGTLSSVTVPDSALVSFNDRAWHRGTPAVKGGWRWFGRISRYQRDGVRIDRGNPRTNETRNQVQVYLPEPNKGW